MQLKKSLAIELAPHNIQVNAILPGWMEADLTEPIKDMPLYQEIPTRAPAGRFGAPDECAGAAGVSRVRGRTLRHGHGARG